MPTALARTGGRLVLEGVATGAPNEVIAAVEDVLSASHATLTDVHFFSGVLVTLHFEIASADVPALGRGLASARVRLDDPSRASLAEACTLDREIVGSLALTLAHGDPDLTREVPHVPG